MNILDIFRLKGIKSSTKIGIGLGGSEDQLKKILEASKRFLQTHESNIVLFVHKSISSKLFNHPLFLSLKHKFSIIECEEPEKEIIRFLKSGDIKAVIRGNLSSHKFLINLKTMLNIEEINRLALLETFNGYQFFFGPVGIDESNNIKEKINFIENALHLFEIISLKPEISILSGGRVDDIGRDHRVDETINNATEIVKIFRDKYELLKINHNQILIESAVKGNANLIIAPDGISGNLIYRTLVHLGGGKAYGAIYMGINNVVIDTSRVGSESEIYGALIIALALTKLKKNLDC
jgi:putative methanogen marker protein 4